MSGLLDGRGAIVTGGGRGIGRAHCLELGRQGAVVIVNDLDEGEADGTVAELDVGMPRAFRILPRGRAESVPKS